MKKLSPPFQFSAAVGTALTIVVLIICVVFSFNPIKPMIGVLIFWCLLYLFLDFIENFPEKM